MRRSEFVDLVAIVDKLMVNLTDFNLLHFGNVAASTTPARKPPGSVITTKVPRRKTPKCPSAEKSRSELLVFLFPGDIHCFNGRILGNFIVGVGRECAPCFAIIE